MPCKTRRVSHLLNTSVEDCRISLQSESDPAVLCDLMIRSHDIGHHTREVIARRRIAQLVREAKK